MRRKGTTNSHGALYHTFMLVYTQRTCAYTRNIRSLAFFSAATGRSDCSSSAARVRIPERTVVCDLVERSGAIGACDHVLTITYKLAVYALKIYDQKLSHWQVSRHSWGSGLDQQQHSGVAQTAVMWVGRWASRTTIAGIA